MNTDVLIENIGMECPFCSKLHDIEKRKRNTQAIVKNEEVEYEEIYYLCPLANQEENEFVPASVMDQNLLRARDAYRKIQGLLTSEDIAKIRKYYGLTQSDFSNLLGWGDVTVTRYESQTIQDQTYDFLMKMAYENPLFLLKNLERQKSRFSNKKFLKIRSNIIKRAEESGLQYLKIQEIQNIYINYFEESEFNGYKLLDLEKLASVMGYFAHFVNNLYKVKLMKLLWYADVLHYKRHGKAMMGLVYKHMTYGALPLAYDEIIHLPVVKVEVEIICDDISYRIIPGREINKSEFTTEELKILELISNKFRNYRSKEIVDYMHEEKAYKKTEPFSVISYNLAKELNELY